jgi:hypothetical protein
VPSHVPSAGECVRSGHVDTALAENCLGMRKRGGSTSAPTATPVGSGAIFSSSTVRCHRLAPATANNPNAVQMIGARTNGAMIG